jgi:hypothetical protein
VAKDDWELAKLLLPPGRCLLDYSEFCSNPEMIEWMLDCGCSVTSSTPDAPHAI